RRLRHLVVPGLVLDRIGHKLAPAAVRDQSVVRMLALRGEPHFSEPLPCRPMGVRAVELEGPSAQATKHFPAKLQVSGGRRTVHDPPDEVALFDLSASRPRTV